MTHPLVQQVLPALEFLTKAEEYQQARSLLLTTLKYLPQDHPEITDFCALTLHKNKFYKEATRWAQKTCQLLPNEFEPHYNLAKCLNSSGEPALAEKHMQLVVNNRPDWVDPQIDLAVYICAQGRFDEAYQILKKAKIKLPPDDRNHDVIEFNSGWHQLREGHFKQGMKSLMIGRKLRIWGAHSHKNPKPKILPGMDFTNKRILIIGEGGAGDEIINARFTKTIQSRGGHCIWCSQHKLGSIISRMPSVESTVEKRDIEQLSYDYWAPAMDLVQLLDLDLPELPNQSYLSAAPEYMKKWQKIIPDNKKLRIGLRWQGNQLYEMDLYRSVPFTEFNHFFNISDELEFYSLQRDSALEELDPNSPVVDLSQKLENWEDTAAAIANLDLVITSCTSIAHLSAALGKKTWVYTPINSYFIWALPQDKSPWYPDVQLFRQSKFRQWTEVTEKMTLELKKLLAIKTNNC